MNQFGKLEYGVTYECHGGRQRWRLGYKLVRSGWGGSFSSPGATPHNLYLGLGFLRPRFPTHPTSGPFLLALWLYSRVRTEDGTSTGWRGRGTTVLTGARGRKNKGHH
jgi:hypothetical protein